jgi:hypothetical protein
MITMKSKPILLLALGVGLWAIATSLYALARSSLSSAAHRQAG